MVTGNGSLSMRWTGVQETMARQHRSCKLNTGGTKDQTVTGQEISRAAFSPQLFLMLRSSCSFGERR